METIKAIEYPQIRYHITYDEILTFKDLEDLIYLIRVSVNAALQQLGIPRSKSNSLQRIERVEPGSIELVATIIDGINLVVSMASLGVSIVNFINKRKKAEREKDFKGMKNEKKLYYRNDINVNNEEQKNLYIDNSAAYNINIHIHNAGNCDKTK